MARVLILSGAGISAESGISTFREHDGLWEQHRIEDVCSAGCLESNYEGTKAFYDARRSALADKEPNKAHKLIASLKHRYPNDIILLTQNVDNLFEKAGVAQDEIIHLHGFLTELRCMECGYIYDIEYQRQDEAYDGACPKCYSKTRPNIVFFGEAAPLYAKLTQALNDCEMIVVIGTSGYVLDVTYFAQLSDYSILNNLEPSDAIDDSYFTKVYYKRVTEAIDEIVKDVVSFLET